MVNAKLTEMINLKLSDYSEPESTNAPMKHQGAMVRLLWALRVLPQPGCMILKPCQAGKRPLHNRRFRVGHKPRDTQSNAIGNTSFAIG